MNGNELDIILREHMSWLKRTSGCSKANLRGAHLAGMHLRGVELSGANLSMADMAETYLRSAYLVGADLRGANLRNANLRWAELRGADLTGADLSDADLYGANLSGANLSGIKYNSGTAFYALQCPGIGEFIGYKHARGFIVELKITASAKRSSSTQRNCRCSEAFVLSITNYDGSPAKISEIQSEFDSNII